MTGARPVRTITVENKCRVFLLITSPELTQHAPSRPPVDVFTSEGGARHAFQRLRLRVGSSSGWAQLVAVDDEVARPLCWFGRPPKPLVAPTSRARWPRRRWTLGALALSVVLIVWASVGLVDRASGAVGPHLSRTGLVTVTEAQRAEATALNTSNACHRAEIWLFDGDGRTVASDASTVCPGQHLAVAYSPPTKVRLRSVVAVHLVPPAVVDPFSHTFEVQDSDTGRTRVVLSGGAGQAR